MGTAGIRLWHYDTTGSYIFILYEDIVSVKHVRIITPAELRELDERGGERRRLADQVGPRQRPEVLRGDQGFDQL